MPSSVAASKAEWRDQFRAYRQALSEDRSAALGALICSRALSLSAVANAATVHVYWPLLDQGEVDTRPLIGALRSQGKDVVLPVVTSYDPAAPTMEHRRYEGPLRMTTNRWGIREPENTERIDVEALDVVLVPALGVAEDGTRIGQGSGYYDAFLEQVTVPIIALIYESCFVPELPATSHDIPVTHVVTERGATAIA